MSYIFDVGDSTVWSPALRIGSLFVAMAECLAGWAGVPTGLTAMASDFYEVDAEVFGAFVQTLAGNASAANEVFGALTHGFTATCLLILDRAGAPAPHLDSAAEAITAMTSVVAARMAT
jgi:hypothetical protein